MEFKKLSDVEVVAEPTESANVLIEENGVIKKAPKTAVGGSSTEWDAVIHLEEGFDMSTVGTFTLVSGTYDDIFNKMAAREMPKIFIYWHYQYSYYTSICTQACNVSLFENNPEDDPGFQIEFMFNGNHYGFYLYSDNTFGLDRWHP